MLTYTVIAWASSMTTEESILSKCHQDGQYTCQNPIWMKRQTPIYSYDVLESMVKIFEAQEPAPGLASHYTG